MNLFIIKIPASGFFLKCNRYLLFIGLGGDLIDTEVLEFISLIRDVATKEMERIFTLGGCYQFHLILKNRFPDAEAFKLVNEEGNLSHVITMINNRFYDINGEIEPLENFRPMNNKDIMTAETFKYPVIQKREAELRDKRARNIRLFTKISNVSIFILLISINSLGFLNFGYIGFWNLVLSNIALLIGLFFLKFLLKFNYIHHINFCRYCGQRLN